MAVPPTPTVFASRLAQQLDARKKAGESQARFAERVGVSAQTITNWRTSHSAPTIGDAAVVAKALGVSLDELAGNVALMEPSLTAAEELILELSNTGLSMALAHLDQRGPQSSPEVAAPDLMEVLRKAQRLARTLQQ